MEDTVDISQELREKLVKPGTERQMVNLHRKVTGRVLTYVTPLPNAVCVRVTPTYLRGRAPYGSKTAVWASIFWRARTGKYHCHIYGVEGADRVFGLESDHLTLKSALRRARKAVARHATEKPPQGWTEELDHHVPPLTSIYPTAEAVEINKRFERAYLAEVERDFLDDPRDEGDQFGQNLVYTEW